MRRDPGEIEALCRSHGEVTHGLRSRQDTDWSLYMLEVFTGTLPGMDQAAIDNEAGYHHHTTSEPRSLFNKCSAIMTGAKQVLTISSSGDPRQNRNVDNMKEEWLWGVFRQGDDRLKRMLQPKLLNQLAYYILLRGWYFGRGMLKKRLDGQTVVDITPWDPRYTYWSVGEDGLLWAAYKTNRTWAQLTSEYGVQPERAEEAETLVPVYDYYDGDHNIVVAQGKYLKPPMQHGFPRIPVWYGNVGTAPLISGGDNNGQLKAKADADWGESIYSAVREDYKLVSYIGSILLELLSRQRDPAMKIRSLDGTKTLEEGGDPNKRGTQLSLGPGEDVEAMKFIETTKDLAILWQAIQGAIQRGTIPYSAFGQIAFAVSGYLVNSLNRSVGNFIEPRMDAAVDAYDQIAHLLIEQYATGGYDVLSLSGYTQQKKYFTIEATAEVIKAGGDPRFYLEAQLPQDDLGKIQAAGYLRQPGTDGRPLASDDYIRTELLKMRNEDNIRDSVLLQVAETATVKAKLFSLFRAAQNDGDKVMAAFYEQDLMRLFQQEMLQASAYGGMGGMPVGGKGTNGNGGSPAVPAGFSPEQLPVTAQGQQPIAGGEAQSNPGPQVPPGTPRPGARRRT